MEPLAVQLRPTLLAARIKAADDNAPPREKRRYTGRRGERLARKIVEETGIY